MIQSGIIGDKEVETHPTSQIRQATASVPLDYRIKVKEEEE